MLQILKRLTCVVGLVFVVMLAGAPQAPARAASDAPFERQATMTVNEALANVQSLRWWLDGIEYSVIWFDAFDIDNAPFPALWLFKDGAFVHDLVLTEQDGVLYFEGSFDGRGNASLTGHARLDEFSNDRFDGTALMLDFDMPMSMRVAVDPLVGIIVGGEKCLCTAANGGVPTTGNCTNQDCDTADDCSPPNNPGSKFCNWREQPDLVTVDVGGLQFDVSTE